MWVIGMDSAKPGMGSMVAREPVSRKMLSERRVRVPPALRATSTVLSATKRPKPMTISAFRFGVVGEVHVTKTVDHALAASADGFHVDVPFSVDDAELCAALEEGGDLGGVDDVLAGEAGDVGAGSAETLVFDVGNFFALEAEMPGEIFAAFSAANDDCVVLFRGGHEGFSLGELIETTLRC